MNEDSESTIEVVDEGTNYPAESLVLNAGLYNQAILFIGAYGWFIVIAVAILIYLRSKFMPKSKQPNSEGLTYEPELAMARQQAMDAARARMQEQYSAQAERYAEQQKIKEEAKRQNRIDEWDRHQSGKGYHSKSKPTEEPNTGSAQKPLTKKKPLRDPDYAPLTGGDGGSCSWRPGSRRGGGGG